MNAENYVRLKITGEEMISDEITNIVMLTPDQTWKLGDFRGKTKARHKNAGWVFNSKLPKESPLEEQVNQLLGALKPVAAKILSISDKMEVVFSCAIYSPSSPPLYFEKATIFQISALGASFDLDLYITGGKEES